MKLNLSNNIRALRRERNLTQEQLAEVLDVTIGAVSKWESGATTPGLEMLVRIADFFELSVDALLGWRLEVGGLTESIARIQSLRQEQDFDSAATLSEKLLQKYPNNFTAVHQAALAYRDKGVARVDNAALNRALELFRRALSLIDQNTDPEITSWQIKNCIGELYVYLMEMEQAVKIYRENNLNGVNDARIAQALSDILKRHDEALPYAKRSFRRMVEDMINSMVALASAYLGKKQTAQGLECLQWLIQNLESLRPDGGFCETDHLCASLMQSIGEIYLEEGQQESAKEWMLRARRTAIAIDSAPPEKRAVCRFFDDSASNEAFYYFYFSEVSAIERLEKRLHQNTPEEKPEYYRLWDEVTHEIEGSEAE